MIIRLDLETTTILLDIFQKELGEEAVDALYDVHHTVFDPINSADLCKS